MLHFFMQRCIPAYSYWLLESKNINLSFSDTLTTLKVMACVALKHGAVLGQSAYFLEFGSSNDH